jgi:hypothetical protein
MAYRLLADAVVVAHALFVAFVVAGGLLALRWRWAAAVHVPCACYGALVVVAGFICPLTPLENRLRRLAGEAGYQGGFVEHYLLRLLYPDPYPAWLGWALGAAVVAANAAVYALVVARARGAGRGPPRRP